MQQIRNGFFPGGNVVVTDNLFFAGVVVHPLGTGFKFLVASAATSDDDLLRSFQFIVFFGRRTTALGGSAAVLFVAPATVPPTAGIARRILGFEIRGRGTTGRLGSRLDVLRNVDFRSRSVVPVSPGNRCCRGPAVGGFSLRSASTTAPAAAPAPLPRKVALTACRRLFARPAPFAAKIAVPLTGSRRCRLRFRPGSGDTFTDDVALLSFLGRGRGGRAESGNGGFDTQSEVVAGGRLGFSRGPRGRRRGRSTGRLLAVAVPGGTVASPTSPTSVTAARPAPRRWPTPGTALFRAT